MDFDYQTIIALIFGAFALFGVKEFVGKQGAKQNRKNELDRLAIEEDRKIKEQRDRDEKRGINDIADNVDKHLDS